jgi:aryl-alcohol dehydrogenase-like predicted oxidoreductase
MRYVDLPLESSGPAPKVSVLGFGGGALMGRSGRKDSLAALAAAFDAGITFYDTARSYGYGEGESLLGEFLQGRRQSAIVCTKFGILPAAKGGWKQTVKPLAQGLVRLFPGLRKYARRQAAGQMQAGQFSLETLRTSFEASLQALRTDYVDMLLLHAAPLEVLDRDDLLEAMGRLVESGKVRMAGISGAHPVITETFRRGPKVLTTAQFALNLANLSFISETSRPEAQRLFLVANHPFGGAEGVGATAARIGSLRNSAALPAELREKLATEDAQLMPEIVLNLILQETGVSAVVPAMMRPASLRSNILAVQHCRFTTAELALLRQELIRRHEPDRPEAEAEIPSGDLPVA